MLKGKRALVTSGPSREAIDPVRFISNHSSGKMGQAIALALAASDIEVELIHGPACDYPTHPKIHLTKVTSAADMYAACMERAKNCDYLIMAAAVADYSVKEISSQKIKKQGEELNLTLVKTKDILKELGSRKSPHQILVGFALETEHELENARKKLIDKNADLIVLNSLRDYGAGFGVDTNKVSILDRYNNVATFELKSKSAVASDILQQIELIENQK